MSSPSYKVPDTFLQGAEQAAEALSTFNDTLVAAHVNLDGDALGSIAACGYMLARLGRRFALYSSTGIPSTLYFAQLPGPVFTHLDDLPFLPKSALYLDCSDPKRLGEELGLRFTDWPSVNIDHHITDRGLGSLANFIQPAAAATSQLVAYVAMVLGIPLRDHLASSIALGLITDTGGFCHANTSADVLALSSLLLRNGCDMALLREQLDSNWSEERVKLWGHLLGSVRLALHRRVAICAVTIKELRSHGCKAEDVEGLVEWFRKIRGVKIAALLRETEHGQWKFSLRSYGNVDVRAVAAALGGGGHKNAAGGTLDSNDPETTLLETIQRLGVLEA